MVDTSFQHRYVSFIYKPSSPFDIIYDSSGDEFIPGEEYEDCGQFKENITLEKKI